MRRTFVSIIAAVGRVAVARGGSGLSPRRGERHLGRIHGQAAGQTRRPALLVDEPSAGLAPVVVQAVFRALRETHAAGTTILLVEQNVPLSLRLAQRGYVVELGRVVLEASGAELRADPHVQAAYLGRT
ncbi:MAG: hypothetical protein M3O91_03400 [Chloroflexota bacterium]|nr:hypothetical protein [Chloroflexota bacterium]